MTDVERRPEEGDREGSHDSLHAADALAGATRRLRQAAVVAGQEYRLSLRNRWTAGLAVLFALFGTVLIGFGGTAAGTTRLGPLVASLASLGTYLLPLAALAFGHDVIVGPDESGWLDVLFGLPSPRWTITLGTYLGRAMAFAVATALGFGVAGAVLVVRTGLGGVGAYATFLLASVGVGLAFLAIATAISAVAARRTHALGGGLLAWVWFVLAHDLVALGAVAAFDVGGSALSAFVLLNPADAYRVAVLQSAGARGGAIAGVLAETGLSTPLLVASLVGWIAVPLAIAAYAVRTRGI